VSVIQTRPSLRPKLSRPTPACHRTLHYFRLTAAQRRVQQCPAVGLSSLNRCVEYGDESVRRPWTTLRKRQPNPHRPVRGYVNRVPTAMRRFPCDPEPRLLPLTLAT
jgi:hypothetical protein